MPANIIKSMQKRQQSAEGIAQQTEHGLANSTSQHSTAHHSTVQNSENESGKKEATEEREKEQTKNTNTHAHSYPYMHKYHRPFTKGYTEKESESEF